LTINKKEIEYIAQLAHLKFSPREVEAFTSDLNDILSYIDKLNQVDTIGVEPMNHAMDMTNAFREDVVTPSLTNEASLANAPETHGGSFQVPKIIE
jgi:aspartyl-tRNA(Asn)/glutamyl-tRNA(Gln) amidotransferase subunit C